MKSIIFQLLRGLHHAHSRGEQSQIRFRAYFGVSLLLLLLLSELFEIGKVFKALVLITALVCWHQGLPT